MPFAKQPGAIAGPRQQLGDRDFVRPHQGSARKSVHDAGAVVVPTGHQARSGRRANRADIEVCAFDRSRGKAIDVRRLNNRVAVATEIAIGLIVGEDEDDTRGLWRAGSVSIRRNDDQAQQNEQTAHGGASAGRDIVVVEVEWVNCRNPI